LNEIKPSQAAMATLGVQGTLNDLYYELTKKSSNRGRPNLSVLVVWDLAKPILG
jgi:hypothetical protein